MKKFYALGPKGSYGHQAAATLITSAYLDWQLELLPSHADVIAGVITEQAHGVVAVENATQGPVMEVLRRFWLKQTIRPDVRVVGELALPVHHCLMIHPDHQNRPYEGRKVLSHEQALGQCGRYLDSLRIVIPIPVRSTSEAARLVAEDPAHKDCVAIASEFAAEIYGLRIIDKAIQDEPLNATRFHVLGHRTPAPTGRDRTAVICWIKDEPGSLNRLSGVTAQAGVQMSFPLALPTGTLDVYGAYFTFDEHLSSSKGASMLRELENASERVLVMGSYPRH